MASRSGVPLLESMPAQHLAGLLFSHTQILETQPVSRCEHGCREKDNPKSWHVARNITIIPPTKQLLDGTPLDAMRAFFSGIGK
jgi:hypothetical protein